MANAGIAGIRLNLIGHADQPLDRWVSAQTLAHVRDLRWHVKVHVEVARLQDIVEPLLDAGMNVVVDHFGRPDPDIGVRDVGFRCLLELADTQRRKLYAQGLLVDDSQAQTMLPVVVDAQSERAIPQEPDAPHTPAPAVAANGSIQLQHGNTSLRIEGVPDATILRLVLERVLR
ncbi:amidohydrolase family protein [Burkholderia sp. JPY481]